MSDKFSDMVKNIVEELALDSVSSSKAVAEGGKAQRKGRGEAAIMKCVAKFPVRSGSLDCGKGGQGFEVASGAGDLAAAEGGKATGAASGSSGKVQTKTVEEKLGYYNSKK